MKGKIFLTLLFLLTSCNGVSSTSSVSDSSTIENGNWDKESYDKISTVLDPEFIPYVNAEAVNVTVEEEKGVPYVDIDFVNGFNKKTIVDEYEALLVKNGFSITDNNGYPYGFKEYSLTEDGIIQYELLESGIFQLVCYKITTRTTAWPEYYIQSICDSLIPVYETVTYEFDIQYNKSAYKGYYLTIRCNKAGENSETDYTSLLQKSGYSIVDNAGLKYATNTKKEIEIIYYYLDDSDDLFMLVHSTSNWPISDVNFFLEGSLPRFLEVPVSDYTYMNNSSDGSEILALYFDGASENAKDVYKAQLIADGWVFDQDDTENGYIFTKSINGKEHMIQLVYGYIESLNIYSFVIAIY